MGEKMKQNRGGYVVGDTMKMAWDVGSVNDQKKSCDEVKNSPRLLLGVMDVLKWAGWIVTLGGD